MPPESQTVLRPLAGTFLSHFESALEPEVLLPADRQQTMHASRPLWARYDLEAVRVRMTKSALRERPQSMWRYRELLPVGNAIEPVSLNEHFSPLVDCPGTARQLGMKELWIKDESRLPTGSFKCRGLSMAVTMARHFGSGRLAISTNGNAGGALAAYAARAGLEAWIACPRNTPRANILEALLAGARVLISDGLIDDNGRWVRMGHDLGVWFDVSTMKEPYRLEGKKSIGLELADQYDWRLPDVILFPTGGGTALIGMWKAFRELGEMGFLESSQLPRMICCQSDGCCPLYNAFLAGERFADRHDNPATLASGIRVPAAIGDFMVLDAIRESGGAVTAAPDSELLDWQERVAGWDGFLVCPETATCLASLQQLRESGQISTTDRVVVFNTAVAQKYFDEIPVKVPTLDLSQETDWDALLAGNWP